MSNCLIGGWLQGQVLSLNMVLIPGGFLSSSDLRANGLARFYPSRHTGRGRVVELQSKGYTWSNVGKVSCSLKVASWLVLIDVVYGLPPRGSGVSEGSGSI